MAFASIYLVLWGIKKRDSILRTDRDKERQIKYLQIQTLQSQINPHFIFNVLGAMQNQILNNDSKTANEHLVKLSKLIRSFLDASVSSNLSYSSKSFDVTLEKEIELLNLYLEFEKLQRPEKINYEFIIDANIDIVNTTIPPMILQPYVENAVKHGLMYKDGPGLLTIRIYKNSSGINIIIEDDGVGRTAAEEIQKKSKRIFKSHGTSLVRERVEILNELGYNIDIKTADRPIGGTIVIINYKD